MSDADASVILTLWMLRASKAVAWINGLLSPADGRLLSSWLFFMRSYLSIRGFRSDFQRERNTMGSIRVAFLAV